MGSRRERELLGPTEKKRKELDLLLRHGSPENGAIRGLPTVRTIDGLLSGAEDQIATAPTNGSEAPATITTETSDRKLWEDVVVPEAKVDPLGEVTLKMYDRDNIEDISALAVHYIGKDGLAAISLLVHEKRFKNRERLRRRRWLRAHPNESETYDAERPGQIDAERERTKRIINARVYGKIQDALGLDTIEKAAIEFQEQRQASNEAQSERASLVYGDSNLAKPKKEVTKEGLEPADLIELILSTNTNPIVRFEARRQLLDVVIGLQLERRRSQVASQLQDKVKADLKRDLLIGPFDEEAREPVYCLLRDGTNEFVGNILVKNRPGRPIPFSGEPTLTGPTTPAPEGMHYTARSLPLRRLKEGDGWAFVFRDQKARGRGIQKAKRIASRNGGGVVRPQNVEDLYKITVVVLGDKSPEDIAYDALDVITKPENQDPEHPFSDGDVKDCNSGGKRSDDKSDELGKRKIEAQFRGINTPIKIYFQTLKEYLAETYGVGTYDRETGYYSGAGHRLYEAHREMGNTWDHPANVYIGLRQPVKRGKRPHPTLEAAADELRSRDVLTW